MNNSVVISLATNAPVLLEYLGVVIPTGLRTVDKRWTWEEVLRVEYGIYFDETTTPLVHIAKSGSKKKHKLTDKVNKFVLEYKTQYVGRVHAVRLMVSTEIRHPPTQTPAPVVPSGSVNGPNQPLASTSSANSHRPLPPPPTMIEMECKSDEEESGQGHSKKKEVMEYDHNDRDDETDPFEQSGYQPPVLNVEIDDEEEEEEDPPPSGTSTEKLFSPPINNDPATGSKKGKVSNQSRDDEGSEYAETIPRFPCTAKSRNTYSALPPYLKSNMSKRRSKNRRIQDDAASVFTTGTQMDVLLESDLDRVDRFKSMMTNLPDGMVVKMHEELSALSDGTWTRWLARAPTATGVLRQCFKIA